MKIGLYARTIKPENRAEISEILIAFSKTNTELFIYEKTLQHMDALAIKCKFSDVLTDDDDLTGKIDFLLCLGGDGTLLDAVKLIKNSQIPVLGINFGRLGFLADVNREEIAETLILLETGRYSIEHRQMIYLDSDKPLFSGINYGLNEFTIHKRDSSSLIIVHTYLNGDYLNSYWADGLIVSTPTGSTGYSLSCGGPILLPTSGNFVITPVAPHNLNVRPIVVPQNSIISFEIEDRENRFLATLDARLEIIDSTYQIAVRKCPFTFPLIRLQSENFLQTLRKKLNWGNDLRNS